MEENNKNPVGRPSKFKPEYCEAIIEFFDIPTHTRELKSEINSTSGKNGQNEFNKKEWVDKPNKLPTFFRFAQSIGVAKSTVLDWADINNKDKYIGFYDAYNAAKEIQKEFLIDNGLAGRYPPASYIFTAKNITDMTDKQNIEHTGKDGTPLPFKVTIESTDKNNDKTDS